MFVDEFMMNYAAGRDNVAKGMHQRFRRYRHILQEFPEEVVRRMMAQFIVQRVFRKDGLIKKYINHVDVRALGSDALAYYRHQQENPWRFCFTEMIDMPAPGFHLHRDVFSGEEYLICSRGMSQTFGDYNESVRLWFNLLAFNGHCWQTYGPIGAYKGIEADDVFYFAGEIDERVSDDDDLIRLLDNDPVPFMMLISGANIPVVANKDDQLRIHRVALDVPELDPQGLAPAFQVDEAQGVFRLSLPRWSAPMHYATAYFDSSDGELFCYSMTERGFNALRRALSKKGITIDAPDIRVNVGALITMEKILARKIRANPYEALFEEPVAEKQEENEHVRKLNVAMDLALRDFNARKAPDYEAYAAASGLTVGELKPIIERSLARVKKLLDS